MRSGGPQGEAMFETGLIRGVMAKFDLGRWPLAAAATAALTLGACMDEPRSGDPAALDDTALASSATDDVQLDHDALIAIAKEHVRAMRAAGEIGDEPAPVM